MSWRVEVAGRTAFAALGAGRDLVVRAVFQRSCYVESAGDSTGMGLACVGDASIGRGPLNAIVERFHMPRLNEVLEISLQRAIVWQPTAMGSPWSDAAGERLVHAARGRIPDEGLGGLLLGASTPLTQHARPAIDALAQWLRGHAQEPGAAPLIGLGPGLTPSGDDFLAGALIALHCFGRAERATQLWAWLAPLVEGHTNSISAAHLAAAAEGEGHEALHACLAAAAAGQDLEAALAQLSAVGHCSGWDALAGAAASLA